MTAGKSSADRREERGAVSGGFRSGWLLVLVAVLCILATVPVVSAHVYLEASTPSNGEQLTDAPSTIALDFSGTAEDVNVTVVDTSGDRVDQGETSLTSGNVVQVPLREIGPGAYTVEWQVIASDGHPIGGSFTFVVIEGDDATQTTASNATWTPSTATTSERTDRTTTDRETTTTGTTSAATTSEGTTTQPSPTTTATTTERSTTASEEDASTTGATTSVEASGQTTTTDGDGFGLVAAVAAIALAATLLAVRRRRD